MSTTVPAYRGGAGGQGLGSALSQATDPLSAMQSADNNNTHGHSDGINTASGPGLAPEEGEGGDGVVAPVTPARLEEIKSILLTIYLEYRYPVTPTTPSQHYYSY